VVSLSCHPYGDLFLSGSADKSVLVWDLKRPGAVAKVAGVGPCLATFDQQGLVFAACVGKPKIHLFDSRAYDKGEFSAFDLSQCIKDGKMVKSAIFSPCGKYLLIRTDSQLLSVDAFDGNLICEYITGATYTIPEACFSPDSQYVLCGTLGGDVCIWSTANAKLVGKLSGHTAIPSHVAFCPLRALVVTAAETVAWWIAPETQTEN